MGEIKSTLELVMERTRHLSLSDEERKEQALSDFRKALSGVIRRFLDGAFTHERFKGELESLESSSGIKGRGLLLELVGDHLVLGGDNDRILGLLRGPLGLDVGGLADILKEYAESIRSESERRSRELKRGLLEKWGIQGSAVQANLTEDESWKSRKEALGKQYSQSLAQEFVRLKSLIA